MSALKLYHRLIEQMRCQQASDQEQVIVGGGGADVGGDQRTRSSTNAKKLRRKVLVALATKSQNENLDNYLQYGHKLLTPIANGEQLTAIFSKHNKGQKNPYICLDDFDKIKVIGKGGFAEKVYLARKKDTGKLYAIKTMCKKFILEEQGRLD